MQYIWRYLRKQPKLLFLDFLGAFFFVLLGPADHPGPDGRRSHPTSRCQPSLLLVCHHVPSDSGWGGGANLALLHRQQAEDRDDSGDA